MARGDHLRVCRNGLYYHHGIDTGRGTVIHYTGGLASFLGKLMSLARLRTKERPAVAETDWEHFLRGGDAEVVAYPPDVEAFVASLFPSYDFNAQKIKKGVYRQLRHQSYRNALGLLLTRMIRGLTRLVSNKLIIRRIRQRYHLRAPEEAMAIANRHLGQKRYHLLTNNCEHFAIYCKTGIKVSPQVIKAANHLLEFSRFNA